MALKAINKPGLNIAIIAAQDNDFDLVDKIIARMSRQERVLKGRKRDAKEKKLGKPWNKATIEERARFTSKYEYDSKRRMYVRRKNPQNYMEVLKRLKKQSREFKRRAKRIGKRGSRMRKSYSPIHTSVVLAAAKHMGLFVDISGADEPQDILTMILSKAKAKALSKDALKGLNKYYSRPMAIDAYILGKSPILVITEDEGLYTFEASGDILGKIKGAFTKATKSLPDGPEFDTIKFDSKHLEFIAKVFNEMGGAVESYFVVSAYEARTAKAVITRLKRAVKLFSDYSGFLRDGTRKQFKTLNRWVQSTSSGKINRATQRDYGKKYTLIVRELRALSKNKQKGLATKASKLLTTLENKAMKKEFMAMIKENLRPKKVAKKSAKAKSETIPKGLLQWVKDYQQTRKAGNIKLAKAIKNSIDKQIKNLGLNKEEVYFYFGDPDKR